MEIETQLNAKSISIQNDDKILVCGDGLSDISEKKSFKVRSSKFNFLIKTWYGERSIALKDLNY